MPAVRTLSGAVECLKKGCTQLTITPYRHSIYNYADITRAFVQYGTNLTAFSMHNVLYLDGLDNSFLRELQNWCMNLEWLRLENQYCTIMDAWYITWGLQTASKLRYLYLSKNGLGAEDIRVLAPSLSSCPLLETLDVSHNNIGANSIKKLTEYLCKMEHFSSFDISSNHFGASAIPALTTMMQRCAHITDLRVGGYVGEYITVAEVDEFLKTCTRLCELQLGRGFFKTDAHIAVVADHIRNMQSLEYFQVDLPPGLLNLDIIGESMLQCPKLKRLNMRGCFMSTTTLQALAPRMTDVVMCLGRNVTSIIGPNIRDLFLSDTRLHVDTFVRAIPACTELEMLNIGNNKIRANMAKDVFTALANNTKLKTLTIRKNPLFTAGGNELALLLPKLPLLNHLDMGYCRFTAKCGRHLLAAIQNLHNLITLDISGLPIPRVLHASLASAITNNPSLIFLTMQNCKLTDNACQVLSKPLEKCANICVLKLLGNAIQSTGYMSLAWALRNATELQTLEVNTFFMTEECIKAFVQYFPIPGNTNRLFFGQHFEIPDHLAMHAMDGLIRRGSLGAMQLQISMCSPTSVRAMSSVLPYLHPESDIHFLAATNNLNLNVWLTARIQAPLLRSAIAFFEGSMAAASVLSPAGQFVRKDGDNAVMVKVLKMLVG